MPSGYKFTNSESEFQLTGEYSKFIWTISDYRRRIGEQKRYGKDGCVITGDQQADSRMLSLDYSACKNNDTDYLYVVNSLVNFFNTQYSPFYFVDTNNDRRCEIVLKQASEEAHTEGLERRVGKNKLDFVMVDGHWEDNTENVVYSGTGGMATGDTMDVVISSGVNCYPVFRITPYEPNLSFTIRNITTGQAFALGSSSFIVGTTFEVDCINGTIYLEILGNQVESSSSLEVGSGFLFFIQGINEIKYESSYGDVDIEITYRERYIF